MLRSFKQLLIFFISSEVNLLLISLLILFFLSFKLIILSLSFKVKQNLFLLNIYNSFFLNEVALSSELIENFFYVTFN